MKGLKIVLALKVLIPGVGTIGRRSKGVSTLTKKNEKQTIF